MINSYYDQYPVPTEKSEADVLYTLGCLLNIHFSLNLSLHFGQATTLLLIGVPLGKLIPFSGPNSNPYCATYITSIRKPYTVHCPVFQLIMMKPRHSKSRAHTLITMLYCFSIMRLHIHHILEETHKIMEKSYNPICSNISGKKPILSICS